MTAKVLCRHCESLFPAPEPTGTRPVLTCPACGVDTYGIIEQEVAMLAGSSADGAHRRAGQLPPLPRAASHVLVRFWEEVRAAYILGSYSGALLLGCSFLEHILNKALGQARPLTLHAAIERCRQRGLIDAPTAQRLLEIKRFIRNRYAHGDFEGIAGEADVQVTTATMQDGVVTIHATETLALSAVPLAQARRKAQHDQGFARPVLQHIRAVAVELIAARPELP